MGPILLLSADHPEIYWHVVLHLPLVLLHQGWHPAVFLTAGCLQRWGITRGLRLFHATGMLNRESLRCQMMRGKLNSLDVIKSCQDAMPKMFSSLSLQT